MPEAEYILPFAIPRRKKVLSAANVDRLLNRGVWAYFLLLIFDGALRKWVVPGLATPLLLVRDPIAFYLILASWKRGLFSWNTYVSAMFLVGVAGLYTAVFWGHGSLPVAIYGARILLLHFPLIFVIGRIFNRDDVEKMGKVILWIAIPMTVLLALQFFSPQTAWVNRGVGGEGAAGFGGAMGYFRPPGTFSFTNGTALFYGLLSCFVFYFWIRPRGTNRLLLIGATAALLAAIPLSISRTLFFQFGVSLIFTLLIISRKPKYMGRMLLAFIGGAVAIAFLNNTDFFQTATEAFTARFEMAGEQEGGVQGTLGDRYLGGMIAVIRESLDYPLLGLGIGMGTNVGSMLLSGQRDFLIAEGEWGRNIGELGPILGLGVIFLRIHLSVKIALASYRMLVRDNLLPWMLLSFGFLTIPQAPWSQPTSLGFSILVGGLMIAAMNSPEKGQ